MKTEIKLNLVWKATFSDGSVIKQFDGDKENKFELVKNRFEELSQFELVHIDKPLLFVVDTRRGFLFINKCHNVAEEIVGSKSNIRLIYFRRRNIDFNIKGEVLDTRISYFLGYQYNDKQGKNRKVLLNIDQDGNVVIGDN